MKTNTKIKVTFTKGKSLEEILKQILINIGR